MSTAKKARTQPPYELLYWPGFPGRGEFARLVFEATGTSYTDVSNQVEGGIKQILALKDENAEWDADGNPPAFAPPALRVLGEGKDGKSLVISQTPAILVRCIQPQSLAR